jgi:hypothetical protein
MPARIAAAESEAYRQIVGPERAIVNIESVVKANQTPFFQRFTGEDSWLNIAANWLLADAYDQVLNQGTSVEQALAGAQEKADAYRNCLINYNAFNNNDMQSNCLHEVGQD